MKCHIETRKEDITKIIIMPFDLSCTKMIVEEFLEQIKIIENLGYTGIYKGKEITIMDLDVDKSYELFKFYDVESIIGIGSAQALTRDLNLNDILVVNASYSNESINASSYLNFYLQDASSSLNIPISITNVYTKDEFYNVDDNYRQMYKTHGCLACDTASFKLFNNAKTFNKKASCLLAISHNLETNEKTTGIQTHESFKNMIQIALESIL